MRGIANEELTCERAMQIGRAAAEVLSSGRRYYPTVLVGMDTRISSKILEAALSAGLASVGANALLLGVVPTPAVAYLVKRYNADAGVMISASHNTVEYNGIKLFSSEGFKLPDSVEEEIEALILDRKDEIRLRDGIEVGRISRLSSACTDYIQHIRECAGAGDYAGVNQRFCFDCANGSSAATARKLFAYLGNGGMAAGFAFDGDADRCLAVDENGKVIDGDRIIAVLAKRMKEKKILKGDAAVVTVMSNLGFHDFMKQNGMKTVCAKVGDRYVLEEMQRSGYNIGGEQSGHIIMLDHATTGDGQLTAAMLIKVMTETGKSLAQLCEGIEDYPQLLVNVKITESGKGKWNKVPAIMDCISAAEKELGGSGRVLVRESGTEPLVRVMVEGKDMDMVKRLADSIAEEVKRSLT